MGAQHMVVYEQVVVTERFRRLSVILNLLGIISDFGLRKNNSVMHGFYSTVRSRYAESSPPKYRKITGDNDDDQRNQGRPEPLHKHRLQIDAVAGRDSGAPCRRGQHKTAMACGNDDVDIRYGIQSQACEDADCYR